MVEFVPGYLFIHCIIVGFKKKYKHCGYGAMLLDECWKEVKKYDFNGLIGVCRKGSFMADHNLFLKNEFTIVEVYNQVTNNNIIA